jgi:hypothetical protein
MNKKFNDLNTSYVMIIEQVGKRSCQILYQHINVSHEKIIRLASNVELTKWELAVASHL